jgi:Icc protein
MYRLGTSQKLSFKRWTEAHLLVGLVLLLGLYSTLSAAGELPPTISGVVYFDANENGIFDSSEAGLAGVAVSNQRTVVTTGPGGRYELPDPGDGIVFVIPPDEYESVSRFWQTVGQDTQGTTADFPLAKSNRGTTFRFLHASDVHLSESTLPRIRELRAIVEEQRPEFVLITGDLIHDALRVDEAEATGYYELFLQEIDAFPVPVMTVPGNHEIFGIERHRSLVSPEHPLYGKAMYRHFLGPTYYSFNAGGIHFVGLDSVDFDDLWYYGHVDETQLEWLRQDLMVISEDTPVVVFTHIPFVTAGDSLSGYTDEPPAPTLIEVNGVTSFRHTVSNAGDALAVLRQRDLTLALAGHDHMRETLSYETEGVQTRFHNAASVRSDAEAAGLTLQSGITVYSIRDGRVDDGKFIAMPTE